MKGLCGMRLQTAGVVIGWLGLVVSFIYIIVASLLLRYADEIVDFFKEIKDDAALNRSVIIFVGSFYLAFATIKMLVSGMLVLGTIQKRHLLLLPWLINSAINLMFNVLFILAGTIMYTQEPQTFNLMPRIFFWAILLMLKLYIYNGIYSLYKHIQANRQHILPLSNRSEAEYIKSAPRYIQI